MIDDPGWLTVAVVVLPLSASVLPLLFGIRHRRIGWPIAVLSVLGTLGVSVPLLFAVFGGETFRYEVGGIPATYGVELVADAVSGVVIVLVLLVVLGALAHIRRAGPRGNAVCSALLLLTGGTLGISLAGDLFNLYVFLEISAIASYALVSSADSRRSTYAAFKYLLLGTLGATIYFLGVAYAFVATGSLNMVEVSRGFTELGYADPLVISSFVFVTVGLAVKIALVPLHTWLADAHAAAPDAISAIVSGMLPAVAVYALARVVFTVYTGEFFATNPVFATALVYAGLLSLFAGSLFALLQRKLKLLLAYSTVAQMGLAVTGVAIANRAATFGAVLHLLGHGIVKAALFILVGLFAFRYGARTIEEYTGLAKRSPVLSGAFVVLGLTLIGVPPTVGFIGKYYIALGAIRSGAWGVAALVIASTLLTIAYVVPVIDRLYFHPIDEDRSNRAAPPRESLVAVVLAVGLAIVLGVVAVPIEAAIGPAIEELIG